MAYCFNCGTQLASGVKYCPECGQRVGVNTEENTARKQVYDGIVHKCPNCGEIINAFVTKCPACGFELRDTNSASSLKTFTNKLDEIEKSREPSGKLSSFASAFGLSKISKTDAEKINLIRNYNIPNTREDIFEFMILAISNISPSSYNEMSSSGNAGERKSEQQVSEAWLAKYLQAYNKAQLAFGNSPELQQIEKSYIQKRKEIKHEKMKRPLFIVAMFAILILLWLVSDGLLAGSRKQEKRLDNELNATVAEIQVDIANGNYDTALVRRIACVMIPACQVVKPNNGMNAAKN